MTSNTFWCVLFLFSLIWSYTWFSLISFSLTYWSSVCLLTSTYLRLSSFSTCWFQGWIVYPACFQFYINLLRIIWAEKYLNLSDPSANQREQARGKKKIKDSQTFSPTKPYYRESMKSNYDRCELNSHKVHMTSKPCGRNQSHMDLWHF